MGLTYFYNDGPTWHSQLKHGLMIDMPEMPQLFVTKTILAHDGRRTRLADFVPDIRSWLEENCSGQYEARFPRDIHKYTMLFFEHKDHAMLFKLAWA